MGKQPQTSHLPNRLLFPSGFKSVWICGVAQSFRFPSLSLCPLKMVSGSDMSIASGDGGLQEFMNRVNSQGPQQEAPNSQLGSGCSPVHTDNWTNHPCRDPDVTTEREVGK